MFDVIKKQLIPGKRKVVPLFERTWIRVAAFIVLLAGGFAAYNLIKDNNQEQSIVKTDHPEDETGQPGSSKAVLTLADGSTIFLENAEGTVAEQGNTKIIKRGSGEVAYTLTGEKPGDILYNVITTPRGGEFQVELSDGSKVWLNAASSLRYPAAFSGNERKVELSGEAYFEVAKNPDLPFKIAIDGKSEVQVLGTHFNINAYHDESTVNTTLLEGRVKVIALASGDSRVINPGEQAVLHVNDGISINSHADTEQSVAWKNGTFNFNHADLGTVLRQLSRWYDVDVRFEGAVPDRQFNGEIQRDLKLSQVLKILEKNRVFCRIKNKTLIVIDKD